MGIVLDHRQEPLRREDFDDGCGRIESQVTIAKKRGPRRLWSDGRTNGTVTAVGVPDAILGFVGGKFLVVRKHGLKIPGQSFWLLKKVGEICLVGSSSFCNSEEKKNW